jgi:hypothetical protein
MRQLQTNQPNPAGVVGQPGLKNDGICQKSAGSDPGLTGFWLVLTIFCPKQADSVI